MNVPTLPADGGPTDFFRGIALGFRALRWVVTVPRLRALSLVCAAVTALALLAAAALAWHFGAVVAAWAVNAEGAWRTVAQVALRVAVTLVFFAVGALTLPNLLLAPLQDPLSEATEGALGGFTPPPFTFPSAVRGVLVSVRHTLVRLVLMTAGSLLLLPLNLVPGVGSALYVGVSSLWSAFWLAAEHLSNPMARHQYRFRTVLSALWKRPFLALGFGSMLWLVLWVPVLNCLLLPVAVVAGTLLYRALRSAGLVAPSP